MKTDIVVEAAWSWLMVLHEYREILPSHRLDETIHTAWREYAEALAEQQNQRPFKDPPNFAV